LYDEGGDHLKGIGSPTYEVQRKNVSEVQGKIRVGKSQAKEATQ